MHTRLSRGFRAVTDWVFHKLLFVIKHPVKTIIWIVKFYISLILFVFFMVASFSAFAQSIYDNLQTQPLVSETVFNYNVTISHPGNLWHVFDPDLDGQIPSADWLGALSKLEELCKADLGDHTGHGVTVTNYTGNHRTDPRYLDFQCQGTWTSSDGEDSGSLSSSHLLFAYSSTVAQVCDANSQLVNGNCYLVADILSNDTCPTGGADILPINGADLSNGFVCQTKQDGSSCKYVMDSSNEFLVSDPEGTACYVDPNVNQWSDTGLNQPTSPTGQCQDIGNGVTACPEDPNNVCPNGQCLSGCGNVTWGGQTQFMCLSDDTDNDGIGDYADPDIDGDGIPNNQDPDADGDGQDDPDYGQGNGSGTVNNVVVTVNNSGVESEVRAVKNAVDQQTQELKDEMTTAKTVDFTVSQELQDMTAENDYETKNFGTVMEEHVNEMKQSPIFTAVDGFFDVTFTGTCPIYSTSVPYIGATITIDHFCKEPMTTLWPIIQAIILLVFTFIAFRVAIL